MQQQQPVYGNGQRSGVITNLTNVEFEMWEESYSEESGDVVAHVCTIKLVHKGWHIW